MEPAFRGRKERSSAPGEGGGFKTAGREIEDFSNLFWCHIESFCDLFDRGASFEIFEHDTASSTPMAFDVTNDPQVEDLG